jgi:hypothetical protein
MKGRARRRARRPTRQEYRERVALTRSLLAERLPKADIKRALRQRYGDLSPRTIERYIHRAREPSARAWSRNGRPRGNDLSRPPNRLGRPRFLTPTADCGPTCGYVARARAHARHCVADRGSRPRSADRDGYVSRAHARV